MTQSRKPRFAIVVDVNAIACREARGVQPVAGRDAHRSGRTQETRQRDLHRRKGKCPLTNASIRSDVAAKPATEADSPRPVARRSVPGRRLQPILLEAWDSTNESIALPRPRSRLGLAGGGRTGAIKRPVGACYSAAGGDPAAAAVLRRGSASLFMRGGGMSVWCHRWSREPRSSAFGPVCAARWPRPRSLA